MIFNRRTRTPADRAHAALAVIRDAYEQYEANHDSGLNTPKYRRATEELASLGPAVVPLLIEVLQAPRADGYSAEANVDRDVANDVAEALGAIGDARAIGPLMQAGREFITEAPRALSMFPEGREALYAGLGDPDEWVRAHCIQGLAYGPNPPENLREVVKRMLTDESGSVRHTAAQVVCGRQIGDPKLVPLLAHMMREDPEEKVRHMAENALHVCRTRMATT